MSTQALSAPISSLSLLLVQTQTARWKAATPEQLTGAQLYFDIVKSGYLFHAVGSVMQYSSIDSDNGLAPNRWQTIIWTNEVSLLTHICISWPQWVNIRTIKLVLYDMWPGQRIIRGFQMSLPNSECVVMKIAHLASSRMSQSCERYVKLLQSSYYSVKRSHGLLWC